MQKPGMDRQARARLEMPGGPHEMSYCPDREELHAALTGEGIAYDDAPRHSQKRHLHVAHERRVLGDVLRLEPGFHLRVCPLLAKDAERCYEHPARPGAGVAYGNVALLLHRLGAVGKHHLLDHL